MYQYSIILKSLIFMRIEKNWIFDLVPILKLLLLFLDK